MEQKTDCSDRSQRELEATLGIEHSEQNQVSGCAIDSLKEGWAKSAFKGNKAHYWINKTHEYEPVISNGSRIGFYVSACGVEATEHPKRNPMFHPGTMSKCKRCELKI